MRLSDDLCNQSSQEILANSVQSMPVERFTSGYGSAEGFNSAGTGVYENYGKQAINTHRQSSEYEDYVNTPPQRIQIPRGEANHLVEEWVDKVHNHLEKEGDSLKPSNDHLYVLDIAGMEKVVNISKMKPFSMNKYVDQKTPSAKESKESAPGFQSDDSQDDYVIVTSRLPNTNSIPESTGNERPELISEVWSPSTIPQHLLRPRSERVRPARYPQ